MNEQKMKTKTTSVVAIIINLLGIGVYFVLAAIFDINPAKEYGWFAGGAHGCWAPAYWIMSWFSDSLLVKAPLHTTAYSVWWWIGVITAGWIWIKTLLNIIACTRILLKK